MILQKPEYVVEDRKTGTFTKQKMDDLRKIIKEFLGGNIFRSY